MDLGERIASARAGADITQQELAEMLFVSRELVSKWELSQRRPDRETLIRIARVLSVPEEELITRREYTFSELQRCMPSGEPIPQERLTALINGFLDGLPPKEADVFIGRFYFMNSTSQIAADCGMRENQVRSRISKAIRKLRKYLKEEIEK